MAISCISESFVNLIGKDSIKDREKYADDVWDIVQASYAKVNGIKGSGFESKESMIKNIPFWKLNIRNGNVIAAIFYKDTAGRKCVATATDGSSVGKKTLAKVLNDTLGISYGEKSGAALGFMMKNISFAVLKNFLITPDAVSKLIGKKVIPATEYDITQLSPADQFTFEKFDNLLDYFYIREIGGHDHLKISIGTPNNKIK